MFTVSVAVISRQGDRGNLGLMSECFNTWHEARWWLTSMVARQLPPHLVQSYDRDQLGDWLTRKLGRITSIGLNFAATERHRVAVVNHDADTIEYYQMGEIVTSKALCEFMNGNGLNIPSPEGLRCIRLPAGIQLFDGHGDAVNALEGEDEYEDARPLPQVPAGQPDMRQLLIPTVIDHDEIEAMAIAAMSEPLPAPPTLSRGQTET